MQSPSVVAYCPVFLNEPVLLARCPSDEKIIDISRDLLDGISLAGKVVPICKVLRWDCTKDIIGFPSTSALNLNAQADSKVVGVNKCSTSPRLGYHSSTKMFCLTQCSELFSSDHM